MPQNVDNSVEKWFWLGISRGLMTDPHKRNMAQQCTKYAHYTRISVQFGFTLVGYVLSLRISRVIDGSIYENYASRICIPGGRGADQNTSGLWITCVGCVSSFTTAGGHARLLREPHMIEVNIDPVY